MQLNVGKEVAAMQEMPVAQLRNRYAEVFGETTNARNKQWMTSAFPMTGKRTSTSQFSPR